MFKRKKRRKLFTDLSNSNNKKLKSANKNKPLSIRASSGMINVRSLIVYVFFILGFALLIYRVSLLQINESNKYLKISRNNYIKTIPVAPIRGNIYDLNGVALTENVKSYSLIMSPTSLKRAKEIFDSLREHIYLTDYDWSRFERIKKNSKHLQDIILKTSLNQTELAKYSILKKDYPEVYIGPTYNRNYFYSKYFTHVVGYTANINSNDQKYLNENSLRADNYLGTYKIGKIGLEKYYEEHLHGYTGYSEVEVNSRGVLLNTISRDEAVKGLDLNTYLDLPTQVFIAKLISKERAIVIASEPDSGKVLAFYSNPSFDANSFVNFITNQDYNALLQDPDRPLVNRGSQGIYPPGSTIKPFMSIVGLSGNYIKPQTKINDPGYWQLPNSKQIYRDWLRTGHGIVDMHKSIVESVDTYYYDLAYRMGINNINKQLSQFGFGSVPVIDLNRQEISRANLPSREWKYNRFKIPWVPGDTPPVGIGQGYFTATPLQLITATNILLNQGVNKGLRLTEHFNPKETSFKISNNNYWDLVKDAMRGVNKEAKGSGVRAFAGAAYSSGGKTGTAQVFNLHGGKYESKKLNKNLHDHALYIGFAPYENPKISIVVIVENGGGGSKIAAPIARQVMDYYLLKRLPVIEDPNLTKEQKRQIAVDLADQLIHGEDIKIKINDTNQD